MDTAEIEVFLVLAEELHFGRTAERLRLPQPRVSRLVAQMTPSFPPALTDAIFPPPAPSGREIRRGPAVRSIHELVSLVVRGQIVHPTASGIPMFTRDDIALIPIIGLPLAAGVGEWLADGLVELYQDYRRSGPDGYAARVHDTVRDLTGTSPRTLEQSLAGP